MDYNIDTTDLGPITITKEAVETLAGMATIDCYGLVGMVSRTVTSGIVSILGLDSIRKGVEVKDTEEGLVVDVYIIVSYGTKISEVASNIKQKIRYVMEQVTGIPVARVNVNVQGVKLVAE